MQHATKIGKRLEIRGQVQGVGYRWAMVEQARRLGVAGWVRNRLDGSVEAVVSGSPEAVERLVEWAHQGPRGARVARVTAGEDPSAVAGPDRFEQRDTA